MFKYLFSTRGRIGRGKFWLGILILLLLFILTQLLVPIVDGVSFQEWAAEDYKPGPTASGLIIWWLVLSIWISVAISVKRCHDRGQSGWYYLISLIPLIGFIWWLVNLGILKGDQGPNKYGPSPRSADAMAEVFS